MSEKIIEITNAREYERHCIICCKETEDIKTFRIRRPKYDDGVISFNVCDECVEQMKNDMESK